MYNTLMFRLITALCCLILLPICFAQTNATAEAKQRIAVAYKSYAKAKSLYVKDNKSKPKLTEYLAATTKLGDLYMYSLGLAPKEKYPNALKYYREILKTDPKNKHAKESADMIIAIYKSLGRPVPKT